MSTNEITIDQQDRIDDLTARITVATVQLRSLQDLIDDPQCASRVYRQSSYRIRDLEDEIARVTDDLHAIIATEANR